MTNLRSTLLLAAATLAGTAGAAQAVTIYGGGASLPAPYFRQAADCWGDRLDIAFRGRAQTTRIADFNYLGTPAFNCATTTVSPGNAVSYISTGSGRGILAYYAKTANAPVDWLGSPPPSIPDPNGGIHPSPFYNFKVNYALSETALGIDRVGGDAGPLTDVYHAGGVIQEGSVVLQVNGPSNPAGTYPNPRNTYGRAIQVPILVAPVVISFDPIYKKTADANGAITEFRYRYSGQRADNSGGLRIKRDAMCRIYNGDQVPEPLRIDNWNEIPSSGNPDGANRANAAATGFTQLVDRSTSPLDPEVQLDVPLQIVGRSDASGTTSIWTRHLAAVCDTYLTEPVNQYNDSTSTLPATLIGGVYNKATPNFPPAPGEVLGKYTIADGNDGVAQYLDFTQVPANGTSIKQGRIGYNGADFVLPYVLNTGQNAFGLNSANVQNSSLTAFVAPTPQTAANAYSVAGAVVDPANPAARDDGFVQRSSETAPVADPAIASGYPIIGTTNGLFYQCYAVSGEASVVRGFLNWYFTNAVVNNTTNGILARAGFSPVPTATRTAIVANFLSNSSGLNLDIRPSTAAFVAQCQLPGAPAGTLVPGA